MNFSQALDLIKNDKKLQRSGWNGRGMFIFIIHAPRVICESDEEHTLESFIVMRPAWGDLIPWLASQADLLAEDWVEYE